MMIQGAPVVLGGKKKSNVPAFAYTGKYNVRDDDVVELLESGEITFVEDGVIDVFMVGGGGGGTGCQSGDTTGHGYGGGGGGYTRTIRRLNIAANTSIPVTVGSGGASKQNGGSTDFNTISVSGGNSVTGNLNNRLKGGAGGSGGGGGVFSNSGFGAGGSDGANGEKGNSNIALGGTGQGFTTREFGESTGKLYGGGGGGGRYMAASSPVVSMGGAGGGGAGGWYGAQNDLYQAAAAGVANTGGGGGGGALWDSVNHSTPGASGGSGIVCFRDAQELPELAGTWVLNERLYAPESDIAENITFTAILTSSAVAECDRVNLSAQSLSIHRVNNSSLTVYNFLTNTWPNKYQRWTFPAGASASDEFRAWLASNATKQS